MSGFWTLFKVTLKNMLRFERKKGTLPLMIAVFAVIGLVFGFMIVAGTLGIGKYFVKYGAVPEFLTVLFLITQAVVLIFGTATIVGVMFFSRDTEFVLALPVKSSVLFFAKLSYVYLTELVISAFVVLTGGITMGLMAGMGPAYYLLLLVSVFVLPLLPLLLAALLALPIMYLFSFFRYKGALTSVMLIVLFAAALVGWYAAFGGMMGSDETIVLPEETILAFKQAMAWVIPDISLARLICGVGVLPNLGITVGVFGALGGLAWLVSAGIFRRSLSAQLEQTRVAKGGRLEYRASSLTCALLKKDFKEILRNPALAFYILFQVVFGPLMLVIMGLMTPALAEEGMDAAALSLTAVIEGLFFLGLMVVSMNYAALSTLTREGENFPLMKALPIPFGTQIRAKVLLARLISAVSVAAGCLTLYLFLPLDLLQAGLMLVFLLVYGDAMTHLLCSFDINNPKLHYESLSAALKNNVNALKAMGVALAVVLPAGIVYGLAFAVGQAGILPFSYAAIFAWILLIGGAAVLNVIFRGILYRNVERRVARIED